MVYVSARNLGDFYSSIQDARELRLYESNGGFMAPRLDSPPPNIPSFFFFFLFLRLDSTRLETTTKTPCCVGSVIQVREGRWMGQDRSNEPQASRIRRRRGGGNATSFLWYTRVNYDRHTARQLYRLFNVPAICRRWIDASLRHEITTNLLEFRIKSWNTCACPERFPWSTSGEREVSGMLALWRIQHHVLILLSWFFITPEIVTGHCDDSDVWWWYYCWNFELSCEIPVESLEKIGRYIYDSLMSFLWFLENVTERCDEWKKMASKEEEMIQRMTISSIMLYMR